MKVEQIYTGCLAQGAYYIESNGEAAVIDPLREVNEYVDLANERNAKIKYIFETHFHADFVSGHVTLSEKTGAPIIYGPNANPSYTHIVAKDNEEFQLGDVKIRVLHTPGHTMESSCFLLLDENGKKHALFSGDTLFLGDVGRPDLAQKAANMTQDDLAGILYESLRDKIMTLPDDVIIYPGHGAGSACGKNMSSETVGSIGEEKHSNYALRESMTKKEFIEEVTDGLLPPPAYFPLNVMLNKTGYKDVDGIIEKGSTQLSPKAFWAAAEETDAVILDVRHQSDFANSHIPGSLFIGIDGSFAPWVGAIVKDVEKPIVLVVEEDRLKETITRLSRVGFDNILGYLKGGIEAWEKSGGEIASIETISTSDLSVLKSKENIEIVDVRKNSEHLSEHVIDSENSPLDLLSDNLYQFSTVGTKYLYCAGGYRSMLAISILKQNDIHNLVNIDGGFDAIREEEGIQVSEYVCPSML